MQKYLILTFVISLIFTGLVGISVISANTFNDTQFKILISTLAFTVYSILGLCCNTVVKTDKVGVGKLGILVCVIGLIVALITTWGTFDWVSLLKARFSLLIVAIAFAHCSLMLLIDNPHAIVISARNTSIMASMMTTFLTISFFYSSTANDDTFKLALIGLIVTVIATIIAPVMALMYPKNAIMTS